MSPVRLLQALMRSLGQALLRARAVALVASLVAVLVALAGGHGAVFALGNDKAPRRTEPVDMIVLHAIGGPRCRDGKVEFSPAPGDAARWRDFFAQADVIGIHHVIDRAGRSLAGIAEDRVANHAKGHNQRSIGIELVNDGDGRDPYTAAQLLSLDRLIEAILRRHPGIVVANVVRHSDLDDRHFDCQGRQVKLKQDPGPAFDLSGMRKRLNRR